MSGVAFEPDFKSWRSAARSLVAAGRRPEEVHWIPLGVPTQSLLFESESRKPERPGPRFPVPKGFLKSAEIVAHHRDDGRWELLYRLLWRIVTESAQLLDNPLDEDLIQLRRWEKEVTRDLHKMKAFVRFRRVEDSYVAWHRPDHLIVPLAAPFFARRFADMRWTILTPDASASWDLESLSYGPGVPRSDAPSSDELEDLWRTYYRSIFNPARVKLKQLRKEMPTRYWSTLPETSIIDELLREQPRAVKKMLETTSVSASHYLPEDRSLASLREAAEGCQGCPLYRDATQVVMGEGPSDAPLVFVGEQPGDEEDRAGRPFIGPAGRILDEALDEVGIDRDQAYLTNAVKHFKWKKQGKRRLHQRPRPGEIGACRPWLTSELTAIRPKVLVLLGATAAYSVLGKVTRLADVRGRFQETSFCKQTLVTIHPSYLLRLPENLRAEEREQFLRELRMAKTALDQ